MPAGKTGDAVRFDHVSLTYAGAGAPSLSDISFTAKQGQTIGVIGGTGSGKSSLVNLIPRFYDATEGSVEILGRAGGAATPADALRGKVADGHAEGPAVRRHHPLQPVVGQQGRHRMPSLWAALETAQAADFVRAKPLGLDEPVEQGGRNLSGGQKQRLTIARALVGKPDILILDDSASALDYATDAALRKALAALPGGLTVFIVSQRAASLQHADQILVLDDGHLVGIGTHEQLLRRPARVYEEIYESQFKKGDAQKHECKSKKQADSAAAQGHPDPGAGQDQTLLRLFVVCSLLVAAVSVARTAVYPHPVRRCHRYDAGQGQCGLCRGAAHCRRSILVVAAVAALCTVAAERVQQPHHLLVSAGTCATRPCARFRPCRCPIWTATPPAISSAAWWRMWTPLRTAC